MNWIRNKFTDNGYKTAYFDEITCIHIGKLAGKRGNVAEQNSYEMNGIAQGGEKPYEYTAYKVINLDEKIGDKQWRHS